MIASAVRAENCLPARGSSNDAIVIDHNDGQFFRVMEWLMFFSRPPLTSMVFNGFKNVEPSPLNVF